MANPSRSDSANRKWALTNFSTYIPGQRIFKHSKSLWLCPTMSSCSPIVPTRELDYLEESLLIYLCSHSPLMGAFFFCVSSVVTNARSAHTDGASVEELTCCKNQRQGSCRLIGVNGGDMLYFDQCTVGNINSPTSLVEHTFCSCESPWSAMVPEVKHTSWKKNLYLALP
jgi:hypothetical protein